MNEYKFSHTDRNGVALAAVILAGLNLLAGWSGFATGVAIIATAAWLRRQASLDSWNVVNVMYSRHFKNSIEIDTNKRVLDVTRQRLVLLERKAKVLGVVGEQEAFVRNMAYDLLIDAQVRGPRDQNVLILWTFPAPLSESEQGAVESTAATVGDCRKYIHNLGGERPWILWTSSCGEAHACPQRITQDKYQHLNASYGVWSPTSTNMDPWQWFIYNLPRQQACYVGFRPASQPAIDE